MHTVIANGIEIETERPIEVIEVNVRPFIITLMLIIAIVAVVFGVAGIQNRRLVKDIETELALSTAMERVYAEAQIEALEGRAKIAQNEAGEYVWISSPWEDGRGTRFNRVDEYLTWNVGE